MEESLMKKIIALLLALAMVLSLAACGGKTEAPAETQAAAPAEPVEFSGKLPAPFAITSCGQSPGATMLNVVAGQAGLTSVNDNAMDVSGLPADTKTLIITTGTSGKGMGAAGLGLAVAPISALAEGAAYKAGTYTATRYGNISYITVETTFSETAITAIKVVENSQRDINIAFMNELAMAFDKMDIDTKAVLEAAGTKWNFLKFFPGLVGGHCIGVDPYYLAQCAQRYGYNPEIILAGRRLNDSMGEYVANQVVKLMLKKGIQVLNSNIIIFGFTFKENCPDVRNTKIIDIYKALKEYNLNITIYDPWANPNIAKHEYGISITNKLPVEKYDALIMGVAHNEFKELNIETFVKEKHVVYDVKGILSKDKIDGRL